MPVQILSMTCRCSLTRSLEKRERDYSEGQMQRIAIARALYADRPVLILDESTSALDQQTERKLLDNLKQLTDKTVLFVSHRLPALEICSKRLHFEEGITLGHSFRP